MTLAAGPITNLVSEYQVGGSLPVEAITYVTRQADQDLLAAVQAGHFCYVLNCRQMGKSSLRIRTVQRLRQQQVACVEIDITELGSQATSAVEWFAGVAFSLSTRLGCMTAPEFFQWWQNHAGLSPVQRLGELVDQVLLVEISQPIAIFLDEIDSTLSLPFKDDFFCSDSDVL
jgi:hypothetical protein